MIQLTYRNYVCDCVCDCVCDLLSAVLDIGAFSLTLGRITKRARALCISLFLYAVDMCKTWSIFSMWSQVFTANEYDSVLSDGNVICNSAGLQVAGQWVSDG